MTVTASVLEAPSFFTEKELAELVAVRKGLELRPRTRQASEEEAPLNIFFSKPFGKFLVTGKTIVRYWQQCSKSVQEELYPIHRYVTQDVRFEVSEKGIFISENYGGTLICGECGQPSRYKMLRAIFEDNPEAHPILRELVERDFRIFVQWGEIGEEGMESISSLFNKFSRGNPALQALASSKISPFNHDPRRQVFVPKQSQDSLIDHWREQLSVFIKDLAR